MKSILILLTACLSYSGFAMAAENPVKVPATFKRIYVPEGFDDNDNVQFVGEGVFSSSCYRYSDTVVSVNHTDKIINITTSAYKYNGMCMQLVLPFDRVVDVGILKQGTYTINQGQTGVQVGSIVIKSSTRGEPDDNLYAPISQALFTSKNGVNKVTLTGDFPMSCMKLRKVETHVLTDGLIIQPIAEMVNTGCKDGTFPFETEVDLGTVKPGRYLLHVRSMNGKSINSLVDVPTAF